MPAGRRIPDAADELQKRGRIYCSDFAGNEDVQIDAQSTPKPSSPHDLIWKTLKGPLGAPEFELADYRIKPCFGLGAKMPLIGFTVMFGKEILGDFGTARKSQGNGGEAQQGEGCA